MYRCESWTIKKAEHQRIDAFKLWCWDSKEIKPVNPKGNQPWIFIGRTDAEAEAPVLGLLMWRADSLERAWCWERSKAGGERDNRGWDGWMASPTRWTWVWASSGIWWWTGQPGVLQSMGSQRVRHDWAMNCGMLGFPVHHQLTELAQTHVHQVGDVTSIYVIHYIHLYNPLSSTSPPPVNLPQHQSLFQ